MKLRRVFVSHSGADDAFSKQLIEDLRARFQDIDSVWYDRAGGVSAGDEWWNEIVNEITSREVFVVILSPDAMESKWVQAEIAVAWNERINTGKAILPVLYRPTSVRADLATLDIISFVDSAVRESYKESFEELVAAIQSPRQAAADDERDLLTSSAGVKALLLTDMQPTFSDNTDTDSVVANLTDPTFMDPEQIEFTKINAVTLGGLRESLKVHDYEIVHLISDGSPSGGDGEDTGFRSAAMENLARLLAFGLVPPSIRLLVFEGVTLASSVDGFIPYAPYMLVVQSEGRTTASQVFMREFYAAYTWQRSIERAYEDAKFVVDVMHLATSLHATLRSRARRGIEGNLMLQVQVGRFPEPLIVDLGSVENDFDGLGVNKDQLLTMIARKIEVHAWIFARPRENAILPIGATIIGMFSWDAAANVITCLRLFRISDETDPQHWQAWCRLLVIYNDLCSEEYRTLKRPAEPTSKYILNRSLHRCEVAYTALASTIDVLVSLGYRSAKLSYSLAETFFERAKDKFAEDDFPMTVSLLESALTTTHDIVTSCMPTTLK